MNNELNTSLDDYIEHNHVPYISNDEWQLHFLHIKSLISEQRKGYLLSGYLAETSYEDYISSVLYTIRDGEVDYCYHEYQIIDLLRFEKERLRTRWLPQEQYFRVWLEQPLSQTL